MHDIDSTHGELQPQFGQAGELDGQGEFGQFGELESDEFGYQGEQENETEVGGDLESPFGEVEEMELTAEFLEIQDEAELDQFIGKLIKRAGRSLGKFVRGPIGKAIGGALKGVAKVGLPILGKAAGGFFGGPAGAAIGGKLGSMATKLFEIDPELEAEMGQDEVQFEAARNFVRAAGASIARAANAPATADPRAVAQAALVAATRRFGAGGRGGRGGVGTGAAGMSGRLGMNGTAGGGQGPGRGMRGRQGGSASGGTGLGLSGGRSATAGGGGGAASGRWYRRGRVVVVVMP